MYFNSEEYCKRCNKLFYSDYNAKYKGVCPKCRKYFEKHPQEYLLLNGEYCKCKNCGKVEYYMFFSDNFNVCNDCMEKFREKPVLEKWFHFRQWFKLTMYLLLNKIFIYIFWILFVAVILFVVFLWVLAMIDNFVSIDDSFLDNPMMKPD